MNDRRSGAACSNSSSARTWRVGRPASRARAGVPASLRCGARDTCAQRRTRGFERVVRRSDTHVDLEVLMKRTQGPWRALLVVLLSASPALAQGSGATPLRAGEKETYSGFALFKTYCGSCHGVAAKGDGPLAEYLRFHPADLTLLARHNKGVWDASKVARTIDGREPVKGHGGTDMPVWGDAFKSAQEGYSEGLRKAEDPSAGGVPRIRASRHTEQCGRPFFQEIAPTLDRRALCSARPAAEDGRLAPELHDEDRVDRVESGRVELQ